MNDAQTHDLERYTDAGRDMVRCVECGDRALIGRLCPFDDCPDR